MPERDAVSWTVLIDGFVKKGMYDMALEWFQEMLFLGTAPDFNIRVNNSLIDMYCKCGCVELACQVFDKMPKRSLVSWNSIIVGLAYNAHADGALSYFHSMKKDGFNPDGVSFTGALNACSHAGLVEKGLELFENMKENYNINPRIEHYGCLVDLYSRAGKLKDALKVLNEMPMKPNEVVISSLLAACRDCNDIGLAERLMKYIYDLDPSGDFNFVVLSNIYAAMGSWQGASNVRKKMKALGVRKRPGISSVEVNGVIHEFVAGDKSHGDAESIYLMLEHLSRELKICGRASEGIFPEASEFS
ncbi:pentatricopeptide repeat-containing protein at1g05750 chloroplastic [Phtheirospermum japonicum]|uniref:Pentatricopeptide repeat-containing protein at1g05750 chloroplastic n=1 Tax=Phtheirospermum japonicum TaxID=374723 RepID=A0A830D750_9LAMI|nr:pentatricopeptide repeat-containing protein at1g05750 chloroplastic [Phtheirospermum japonicum]